METKKLFLDNQSTTKISKEVLEAMLPFLEEKFGNPGSPHQWGREAAFAIDRARRQLAGFFEVKKEEVIFTSGATESNSLIVWGTFLAALKQGRTKLHFVTSNIEHASAFEPFKFLEETFPGAQVTYLKVNKLGLIDPKDLQEVLTPDTILVSLMQANNEIGTCFDIPACGKIIEKYRKNQNLTYPIFHTDGAQGVQFLEHRFSRLHIDAMSVSAQKMHGPKGMGALILKQTVPFEPLFHGGGQEYGKRPGTSNVAGIVGLAKAAELIQNRDVATVDNLVAIRDYLYDQLHEKFGVSLNGDQNHRLPNNLNVAFPDNNAQDLIIALDLHNIAVSGGAACHTGGFHNSHVLEAILDDKTKIQNSIRISLDITTSKKDVDYFIRVLDDIIRDK
jgi:cysteine desulfurase